MMTFGKTSKKPRIGLLWSQFSAYHVDRCEAVARRFGESAEVIACEVASTSSTYAWDVSGVVEGAHKVTLFPAEPYDKISWISRFSKQFQAMSKCDFVFVGVSYGEKDIIALAFALRCLGISVFMMTESKFDDRLRRVEYELLKWLVLAPYSGALVGSTRQREYVYFLGFRSRPIFEGYDTVGMERVQRMADAQSGISTFDHEERAFLFVGRFVRKKRLPFLIEAYKKYVDRPGAKIRKLVVVGSGEEETLAKQKVSDFSLNDLVEFRGFLQAPQIAAQMATSLALILPSIEEQWGLVVNEAIALQLPIIVAENVGSRDALVRNLINGFVFERDNIEGLAEAMFLLSNDPDLWQRMSNASHQFVQNADTSRFADGVASLINSAKA